MTLTLRRSLFVVFLSLILGASSCGDDDLEPTLGIGSIELSIQGELAGDDLTLESRTYDASGAAEGFRMSRLSFFLSDLRLVELRDGQSFETPVADVAYFNLGPSGLDSEVFDTIPSGDYTSLRFNFGLTEEQDMTSPADYATTHPLGEPAEYWANWESYIFAKIEGKTDTLPDNQERFDASFVFHIGVSAENARPGEIPINLPVRGGINELKLNLDVAELMQLNTANELPLTKFIHGGPLTEQIPTSAVAALSTAE